MVQAAFNAQIQFVVNALKIIILLVQSVYQLAQLVLHLQLVRHVLAIAIYYGIRVHVCKHALMDFSKLVSHAKLAIALVKLAM